jgi:hypothetical protein
MFQKSKIARTRIADLPESLFQLSAQELDKVSGGMRLAAFRGAGSLGGLSVTCGTTTKPASVTNPGQVDTATDGDDCTL